MVRNAGLRDDRPAPAFKGCQLAGEIREVVADARQVLAGEGAGADGVGRAGSALFQRFLVQADLFIQFCSRPDGGRHALRDSTSRSRLSWTWWT